jgi:hypothetical protein
MIILHPDNLSNKISSYSLVIESLNAI